MTRQTGSPDAPPERPRPLPAFARASLVLAVAILVAVPAAGLLPAGPAQSLLPPIPSSGEESPLAAAVASLSEGHGPAAGTTPNCQVSATTARCGGAAAAGWTNLTATLNVSPSDRGDAQMVYDPMAGEVVLFGGWGGGYGVVTLLNDTWSFASGAWTNLTTSFGRAPPARWDGGMTWDGADQKIVLFGGWMANGTVLNDTWTFSAGGWTELHPARSPPARHDASIAYDSTDGYVVLFGGSPWMGSPMFLNDTWTFQGGNWTAVAPAGGVSPPPRRLAVLVDDPVAGGVLLFGGVTPGFQLFSDTWLFAHGGWTQLAPALSPPARFDGSVTFDPSAGAPILFGGCLLQDCAAPLNDTWAFESGTWQNLTAQLPLSPSLRGGGAFAFDPEIHADLLFGGSWGGHDNDTWRLDAAGLNLSGASGNGSGSGNRSGSGNMSGTGAPLAVSISAAPSNGTAPVLVGFAANVTGGTSSVTVAWSFGDGGNASGLDVNHTYSSAGTYWVRALASDAVGATASASVIVTLLNGPTAGASGGNGSGNSSGLGAPHSVQGGAGGPTDGASVSLGFLRLLWLAVVVLGVLAGAFGTNALLQWRERGPPRRG